VPQVPLYQYANPLGHQHDPCAYLDNAGIQAMRVPGMMRATDWPIVGEQRRAVSAWACRSTRERRHSSGPRPTEP
jgi:hypothetical protein